MQVIDIRNSDPETEGLRVIFGFGGEYILYDSSELGNYPFQITSESEGDALRFGEQELTNLSKAITKVLEVYRAKSGN